MATRNKFSRSGIYPYDVMQKAARMTRRCKGCIFAGKIDNALYCNYTGIMGVSRPCPPGDACTIKTTGKQRGRPAKPKPTDKG